MNKTKIISVLLIFFIICTFIFGFFAYKLNRSLAEEKKITALCYENKQILGFINLYISKVLLAKQEIDFETRLELEKAVINLQNEKISTSWKKFTDSRSEEEAQDNGYDLMTLLLKEIEIK